MTRPEPWYAAGLAFECTQCGACCRREGDVSFTRAEADRVARHLHGPKASAATLAGELWLEEFDGSYRIPVPADSACPFLSAQNACTIQTLKPTQCATYPFWSEVVASDALWNAERPHCEGIGRGPTVSATEIAMQLNREASG